MLEAFNLRFVGNPYLGIASRLPVIQPAAAAEREVHPDLTKFGPLMQVNQFHDSRGSIVRKLWLPQHNNTA